MVLGVATACPPEPPLPTLPSLPGGQRGCSSVRKPSETFLQPWEGP